MTAEKILDTARAQLGIREEPPNSNRVKFNTAYYGREVSGSAYPWCCAFVWWVFRGEENCQLLRAAQFPQGTGGTGRLPAGGYYLF